MAEARQGTHPGVKYASIATCMYSVQGPQPKIAKISACKSHMPEWLLFQVSWIILRISGTVNAVAR